MSIPKEYIDCVNCGVTKLNKYYSKSMTSYKKILNKNYIWKFTSKGTQWCLTYKCLEYLTIN